MNIRISRVILSSGGGIILSHLSQEDKSLTPHHVVIVYEVWAIFSESLHRTVERPCAVLYMEMFINFSQIVCNEIGSHTFVLHYNILVLTLIKETTNTHTHIHKNAKTHTNEIARPHTSTRAGQNTHIGPHARQTRTGARQNSYTCTTKHTHTHTLTPSLTLTDFFHRYLRKEYYPSGL